MTQEREKLYCMFCMKEGVVREIEFIKSKSVDFKVCPIHNLTKGVNAGYITKYISSLEEIIVSLKVNYPYSSREKDK